MHKRIRNAKAVQSKSRRNEVHPLGGNRYQVVSATSGNVYDVTLTGNGGRCNCDWGQYRAAHDQRSGCSHVLATIQFAAVANGNASVSAWGDEAQAERQHRRIMDIGDGVFVTVRA
jgi:hypothetical protein